MRERTEEFDAIKQHPLNGSAILGGSRFPVLQLAEEIARAHHERWDGSGYPAGLRGEQIPRPGRTVAVVDVFDALIQERPYKRAWSLEEAVAELRAQRGRMLEPEVVDRFLEILERGKFPLSDTEPAG